MRRLFSLLIICLFWLGSAQALDTLRYAVCDTSLAEHKAAGYDSLFVDWIAWEAMNRNLTTDNAVCIVDFYNDGDTMKTWSALTIGTGWTTSDSERIILTTPASERHDGTDSTGFRVTIATADEVITVSENYVTIEGLSIYQPNAEEAISFSGLATGAHIRISHCLLRGSANGTRGIYLSDADANLKVWNNFIHDWHGTSGRGIWIYQSNKVWLYNNTIYDCETDGIYVMVQSAGKVIAKNNTVIAEASGSDFNGTFAGNDSSDYNCSGDATAPGTHSLHNKAAYDVFSDTTRSTPNLCLKTNSVCIDSATDLSSDPNLPFNDDILGTIRTGTWDMGGCEFVKAKKAKHVIKTSIKNANVIFKK